jgi:hypothetical protein
MGFIAENKYFVSGDIESGGIVLNIANSASGTNSFSITTYSDFNYSATTYAQTAFYEGEYDSSTTALKAVEWTGIGAANDVKYQYATSTDGITYTAWSAQLDAIGSKSLDITPRWFKLRYHFYSSYWTDSDSIEITKVEPQFNRFVKGTIIDADEKMANFYFVSTDHLLPRGGLQLLPTTSVYNLGDDINKWDTVHLKNYNEINSATMAGGNFIQLIDETNISTATTRIEFTGLNGDSSEYYIIHISAKSAVTSSAFLYLNGDSNTTNYGYQYLQGVASSEIAGRDSSNSGMNIGQIKYGTTTTDKLKTYGIIYTKTGLERLGVIKWQTSGGKYVYSNYLYSCVWNNTSDTITSIILENNVGTWGTNTNIQLWGKK